MKLLRSTSSAQYVRMVEGLALSARLDNRNRKNRQKIEKSKKDKKSKNRQIEKGMSRDFDNVPMRRH
jgi:hypothetical protein